jgi:hypothetical protein
MAIQAFSNEVSQMIDHYVYRLIDPRDGSTFYVGKGQGNRIFAHMSDTIKQGDEHQDDDDWDLKLATIRDIVNAKLEVIHVIHRHGMCEDAAFEVEAALIDAYPGLTNKIGGCGSADRGAMNAQQVQDQYEAKVIQSFDGHKCVIIKIRQANVNNNDGDIYKTARAAWRIGHDKVAQLNSTPHFVLAVVNGIVKAVYEDVEWSRYLNSKRYCFDARVSGDKQPGKEWPGCRLPPDFTKKGLANPVLFTSHKF